MEITKINRVQTHSFSNIANTLSYRQSTLSEFIQTPFDKSAFASQIELKSKHYSSEKRHILVRELNQAYQGKSSPSIDENLELLGLANTFTITTGHQLSLFTGPLFSIFKIAHVIKMCQELKIAYPDFHFVPVFWMATEDHDFEEINHFNLMGSRKTWNTEQKGPVGRFNIESLSEIREELHDFFKNQPESPIHQLIDSYNGNNLSEAHFNLVHELFKDHGLIIVEADNANLKRVFLPVIKQELFERLAEKNIQATTSKLEKLGFKGQVFPREINFFYIENGFRERIQWKEDHFFIEGRGEFSLTAMEEILEQHPERFSPNVIFRPIYQESILPNLCYVGGGGEMAYWLQLKSVFLDVHVVYPLIQVRNSLQLIDKGTMKKLNKLGMHFADFWGETEVIKKKYIAENAEDHFDFDKIAQKEAELSKEMTRQIAPIDTQLKQFIDVEINKLNKQIENIHTKVLRVQKQKMETSMNQIESLKERLFPERNLQERVDNFLNFCPTGDYRELLNNIYEAVDPFNPDFIVVEL